MAAMKHSQKSSHHAISYQEADIIRSQLGSGSLPWCAAPEPTQAYRYEAPIHSQPQCHVIFSLQRKTQHLM